MLDILTPGQPTLVLDAGSRYLSGLLAFPGQPLSAWPRFVLPADEPEIAHRVRAFLEGSGVAVPEAMLVCSMGDHHSEGSSADARRFRMDGWRELLRLSEGRPEACLSPDASAFLPPSLPLPPVDGPTLAADSGIAAVLAALSQEKLRDRCWNEGVTIVYAGHSHVQAFMVYQEKILGLYEQHSDISREALLDDLKEMRLNWLPEEKVRSEGGHGCICGDFPAEAEGFRPTWIFGPRREILKGCGRLVSFPDEGFERCYGLLYGLGRMDAGRTAS